MAHDMNNSQPNIRRAQRPRLVGEVLIGDGHITEEQLSQALAEQKNAGRMLGEVLVDQGMISGSYSRSIIGQVLSVFARSAASSWLDGSRA